MHTVMTLRVDIDVDSYYIRVFKDIADTEIARILSFTSECMDVFGWKRIYSRVYEVTDLETGE